VLNIELDQIIEVCDSDIAVINQCVQIMYDFHNYGSYVCLYSYVSRHASFLMNNGRPSLL